MKLKNIKKNKGFTLIETMIAVFILVVAMSALLGLISSSLFSARYAKNDIIANYLIQETVDYIRNDRDTIAFLKHGDRSNDWNNFLNKYGSPGSMCFSNDGCEIEPALATVNACDGNVGKFGVIGCKLFHYDEEARNKDFYTYINNGTEVNFKRQVKMTMSPNNNGDELDIKVTVEWQNGSLVRSRSSRVSLLNWQL